MNGGDFARCRISCKIMRVPAMEHAMTDRMFDDPDQLLEQTRSLRLLARRLVADPHGAEDLVQSTWLVAYSDTGPENRPTRWLRGILRNLRRQERRSARRRRQREEAVARPAAVDADSVEQLETLQAVVEAVRGLPTGYRETVIARYFKDEKPRETARRLNVPASTIHTRLHRAIGLLREALDRRHGGDRQSWRSALISLESLAPSVIVGAKLKVAVLAAAVVGLVWSISEVLPRTQSGPPISRTGAQVVADTTNAGEPPPIRPAGLGAPDPGNLAPPPGIGRRVDEPNRRPPPGRPGPSSASRTPRPVGSAVSGPHASPLPRADDLALLNQLAQDWFSIWFEREQPDVDTSARRRLQSALTRAKDEFLREWDRVSKKRDLMASYPDLREVFHNAFPYSKVPGKTTGRVTEVSPTEDTPAYDLRVPRSYDASRPHRLVVLVPGIDQGGSYRIRAEDYFAATWERAEVSDESIFVIPRVSENPTLDWYLESDALEQNTGSASLFLPMASVQRTYRLDRERVFLDCGRGSSGFGVWMAANFPSRFAGLILRWPVDVSDLRLGSLTGLPVLVITNPETRPAGLELARRLNQLEEGTCTVLDGKGWYPFPDSSHEIEHWIREIRRRENPKRVVIEPNNDLFNDGFWVRITRAKPLALVTPDRQTKLIVEADKVANQIRISATGVTGLELLLNHELVDLDRPFTVITNGEVMEQTRRPSLNTLTFGMFGAFDPTWIYTSSLAVRVPRR